jgi:hypothetical protein
MFVSAGWSRRPSRAAPVHASLGASHRHCRLHLTDCSTKNWQADSQTAAPNSVKHSTPSNTSRPAPPSGSRATTHSQGKRFENSSAARCSVRWRARGGGKEGNTRTSAGRCGGGWVGKTRAAPRPDHMPVVPLWRMQGPTHTTVACTASIAAARQMHHDSTPQSPAAS